MGQEYYIIHLKGRGKMKAVIIAGGKGTRMAEVYPDIPKPMIPIDGVPVLERTIICLREQGIRDLFITVQHKAEIIINFFGDGKKFGVDIQYFIEQIPMGNAGALFSLSDQLDEDFLLINADLVFDIDLRRFIRFHQENKALATIIVHPNDHPYDSGIIECADDGRVTKWHMKENRRELYYNNLVNAGIHILSSEIPKQKNIKSRVDLDRDILTPMIEKGEVFAYKTPEYIKDMGTPERLKQVENDFKNGIIQRRSLLKKQKAIFLDRDGTINRYVGFMTCIDDFELLPGVVDAIKIFRDLGYLVIVITNQPVIARGDITIDELDEIHKKMETLLGNEGAYVDDLFYCPHHPDKGFEGEVLKYKVECGCRKPKPGMLFEAARKYNIELSESWMVGDGENDIKAGRNAGCKTCFLSKNHTKDLGQVYTLSSLICFANRLKEEEHVE